MNLAYKKTIWWFFKNVPDNVVICINENITKEKIFPQITKKTCAIIDCTNDWKLRKKLIINETGKCVDSCTESPLYKYEYNDFCFENCSNGYYIEEDKYKCKCELEKCFTCSDESLKQNLCTKCNTNYYQKDDDLFNIFGFIDCYKDPKDII